jgi:hypothetical protein
VVAVWVAHATREKHLRGASTAIIRAPPGHNSKRARRGARRHRFSVTPRHGAFCTRALSARRRSQRQTPGRRKIALQVRRSGGWITFRSIAIGFALCLATATAQAALQGRAPATPGGTDYQAYYDTTQNITWVTDSNLAGSPSGYCFVVECPDGPSGELDFPLAQASVAWLNANGYLGVTNWRLPNTLAPDPSCSLITQPGQIPSLGCAGSEMGHLF